MATLLGKNSNITTRTTKIDEIKRRIIRQPYTPQEFSEIYKEIEKGMIEKCRISYDYWKSNNNFIKIEDCDNCQYRERNIKYIYMNETKAYMMFIIKVLRIGTANQFYSVEIINDNTDIIMDILLKEEQKSE